MTSLSENLSNSTAYAEAIFQLQRHGGTVREISQHSGLGYNTTRKLIQALHRRGVIRVALWRRDGIGRERLPVYFFGTGPDAKRPLGMTREERVRRYNDKRREIAERLGIPMRGVRLRDYKEENTP